MVQLPPTVGSKNQNEPAGFTAHGIDLSPLSPSVHPSIDQRAAERGSRKRWDVTPGISESGIRTQLMLGHIGLTLPAPDTDEPAPPVWDALCRLERMLRSRRDVIAARGRRSHAELLEAG